MKVYQLIRDCTMKVYEVIRDCTISYTKDGEDGDFVLYKGDYFFIEHSLLWIRSEPHQHSPNKKYIKSSLLLKIYHNKMVDFEGNKKWTLIDDINLIDPKINKIIDVEDTTSGIYGPAICKDVTIQWNRDEKLNKLININE